jgi:hypothetical protein
MFHQLLIRGCAVWEEALGPHAMSGGVTLELPREAQTVLALLQRQRSLYGAVCRLLEVPGMSAEAVILGRPLFEESVFLDFVSRVTEPVRYGYTLYYERDGLKRARHAFEVLMREHP